MERNRSKAFYSIGSVAVLAAAGGLFALHQQSGPASSHAARSVAKPAVVTSCESVGAWCGDAQFQAETRSTQAYCSSVGGWCADAARKAQSRVPR